ncbi:UNVERIFIED_CONTAM: hypothetical protein FKN15_015734 [Acipenser sinensis]
MADAKPRREDELWARLEELVAGLGVESDLKTAPCGKEMELGERELFATSKPKGFYVHGDVQTNISENFFELFATSKPKGFYVHGDVGTGKTVGVDMFYSHVEAEKRKRLQRAEETTERNVQ